MFDEASPAAANDAGSFVTVVPTAMKEREEEEGGTKSVMFTPSRLGLVVSALPLSLVLIACHTKALDVAGTRM